MKIHHFLSLLAVLIILSMGGTILLNNPQNTDRVLPTLASLPTSEAVALAITQDTVATAEQHQESPQFEAEDIQINEPIEPTSTPIIESPTENQIASTETLGITVSEQPTSTNSNTVSNNATVTQQPIIQNVISEESIPNLRQTSNETQVPIDETLDVPANNANSIGFANLDNPQFVVTTSNVQIHPQVLTDLEQNGTAEVIITLNLPTSRGADRSQERRAISQAQNNIMANQKNGDFQLNKAYQNIPVIHAHINQNALNGLANNPNILTITPNFGGEFALAEARVAIGGEVAMANYGFTGEGITVAILDTGVDTDHPDLVDSIIAQKCFTDTNCGGGSSESNNAEDDYGHGTHVTGIITSPAGFAPNANIVSVKIGSAYQSPELRLSDVLAALNWLITELDAGNLDVDIVNMSFSFNWSYSAAACDALLGYTALRSAIDTLVTNHNVAVFAASGNSGSTQNIGLPACYSNVIGVGATYDNGTIPSYEQQTCTDRPYNVNTITCYSNTTNWLDIVTTGSSIISTAMGGGYTSMSGTSMASPTAAGIAALMREADPSLTPSEILQIMQNTGYWAYNKTNNVYVKRIDVWNAIYAIAADTAIAGCNPNQQIRRVSIGMDGSQSNAFSIGHSISGDGRYVSFASYANNLLPTDTNGYMDVFVYDLQTCRLERISTSTSGWQANAPNGAIDYQVWFQGLSSDGRYAVFANNSTSLVSGDTNNQPDIFLHDRLWAYTTRASRSSNGTISNGENYVPHISANGLFVIFNSKGTNLVGNDSNGFDDLFMFNQLNSTTTRISVDSSGNQSNNYSTGKTIISPNGQVIVFGSSASNFVGNDTNNAMDVFVRDLIAGTTERVSISTSGAESNGRSFAQDISSDGRYVLFSSEATTLSPDATDGNWHLYLHDRQTDETTLLALADGGSSVGIVWDATMSDDARYIVFSSEDTILVPNDTNAREDVFIHDRQTLRTARISVSALGAEGTFTSFEGEVSSDGQFVAFRSNASNLVSDDTNSTSDIFVVDTSYLLPPDFIYAAENLTATMTSLSQVTLTWDDMSTDESGFIIERSTDGSSWSGLTTVPANSTSYEDNTATCSAGTTYQYRVQAYRSNADASTTYSDYSNTDSAENYSCAPPDPIILISPADSASFPHTTSVVFIWTADSSASQYYLEYWGGTSADVITSGWISSTSWDAGALKGGVYQWRVKGRNPVFEGDWSSPWSFTATLAAPSNLQAIPATTSIDLTWTASSDAPDNIAGYNLYHDNVLLTSIAADATGYTHSNLLCDDPQDYYLTAYETPNFESPASSTLNTSTTACPTPETATNLAVEYKNGEIILTWLINYDEASTTYIERSIDGGAWAEITSQSSDIMTYTDSSLPCDSDISYRLYASRDRVGPNSVYSDEVSYFTRPCEPNTLATSSSDKSEIELSWVDASVSETQFYVEISANGTSAWQLASALPANSTSYTLTGLSCGTTRYFRIRAYRDSDNVNSIYSEIVSGMSQSCPALAAAAQPSSATVTTASVSFIVDSATTEDIQNIRVQRSTDNTNWNEIGVLPASGGLWVDSTVQCGTTYYYRTVNYRPEDGTFSPASASLMITTDPCLPIVASSIGLYYQGLWQFSDSLSGGSSVSQIAFGVNEDGWQAIVGDWNGDGTDGIGLYKNGLFMLRDGTEWSVNFGSLESGWQAIVGDWDGNGSDGIGLYKDGVFMLRNTADNGAADYHFSFGGNTYAWQAIAGDWDGNGSDTVGLYYNGQWQLSQSHNSNPSTINLNFGTAEAGWIAISGDWNGDGIDSLGLYKTGVWKLRDSNSSGAPDYTFNFGSMQAAWLPIAIGATSIP